MIDADEADHAGHCRMADVAILTSMVRDGKPSEQ